MKQQRGRSGLTIRRRASSIISILSAVCVLFLAIAVIGGGWFVSNYRNESKAARQAIEESEVQKVAFRSDLTLVQLQNVRTDIKYLLWGSNLGELLSAYDSDARSLIRSQLIEFCSIAHNYDQISCFGSDGREFVFYQDSGGDISRIGMSDIQQKQDLAYLKKIFELHPDQILASQIDLTDLFDIPNKSPRPFIRFGAPVLNRQGVLQGAVVLFYQLKHVMDAIPATEAENGGGDEVILDAKGNWLVAPSQPNEWDDGYGQFKTFQTRFPKVWDRIKQGASGQFYDRDSLFSFSTISPFNSDALLDYGVWSSSDSGMHAATGQNWKVISWISAEQLTRTTQAIFLKHLFFYLAVIVISAGGLFWIARSMLRQARIEEALRQSEEQYRTLTDSLPVGVYRMTVQPPQFVAVNPALAKIYGFETVDEFLSDTARLQSLSHRLCQKGKIADEEVQLKRVDGDDLSIRFSAETSTSETGEIEYVDGVVMDITQQKRAEDERATLQRLAHRLTGPLSAREIGKVVAEEARRLFQHDAFVLLLLDPNKQNFLTGYFEDTIDDSVGPIEVESESKMELWEANCMESSVINRWEEPSETQFTPFGNVKRISRSLLFVPIRWENRTVGRLSIQSYTPGKYNDRDLHLLETFADECSGAVARMWNREQRIKLEMQLRQAQKMEAVGQLAGGIAHDFNNLLQAILGYTHMAKMGLSANDQRHRDLEQIQKAGERAAALTRQLLAFGRRQIMQPESLVLNGIVEDMASVLQRSVGSSIDIQFEFEPELKNVYVDRSMIEQILINVCLNSRDAMPDGGTVTVATRNAELSEAFCHKRHWAQPGKYSILEIRDTGKGILPEHLDRIFEPFFTTKEVGKGTGLGLSTVYGIIKQHHGLVDVTSLPNQGANFTFYFPVESPSDRADDFQFRQQAVFGGNETILLVENNDAVRFLAQRILERNGYTVIPALDGEEAIRLYEEHCDAIHLAVLDLDMPKLNGKLVYEQLVKIKSNVRVLFSSEKDGETAREDFTIPDECQLLHKPFSNEELLQIMRTVLAGSKVGV